MINCDWTTQVGPYHDGELPTPDREEMEAHLATCPACSAELESLRRLSDRFGLLGDEDLSVGLRRRMHASVARLRRDLTVRRFALRVSAVAAAVVIACGAALWHASQQTPDTGEHPPWEAAALLRQEEPAASGTPEALVAMMSELSENGDNGN